MSKIAEKPGDILKSAREKKNWTQEDLSKKIGISLRQYNKYEGNSFPKYKSDTIKKLDKLLGTNLYELIYEQSVPREENESNARKMDIKVTADLSEWMGRMEEEIIGLKARVTVIQVTLENLVSDSTGKAISTVTVELQKAISDMRKMLFAELREQNKKP